MSTLTIQHTDFTLTFKYTGLGVTPLMKARRNLRDETALRTRYEWTDGVTKVELNGKDLTESAADAFFFDNTDYAVWMDFSHKPDVAPVVRTMRADIQKSFSWHDGKAVLSGFLNYGHDIGKSDFSFDYIIANEMKHFSFCYEVLSSKLDYHAHFTKIVEDIEAEYRMLSLDFLRRTYHTFAHDPSSRQPLDLIWWNLFRTWQDKFIRSARLILQKPRHRRQQLVRHVRADCLKTLTPAQENELVEHRGNPARRYREDIWTPSNDTPENRFFKHALATVSKRHDGIVRQIRGMGNVAENTRRQMDDKAAELRILRAQPFFRTVGEFHGLEQESLVLQRADGYATLARVFVILNASYALKDGLSTLETKDIATLYEIWCFIAVKNIVKEICGEGSLDQQNRGELSKRFVYNLAAGSHSRILFKNTTDGTELAELFYNATTGALDEPDGKIVAPSGVEQKPDIVLRLTKPVAGDNAFKLTYLFDAKYRLGNASDGVVDAPPDDAINQMHRYRDAIYYRSQERDFLRKEIIGGYILFPGNGVAADVEAARFYQSIAEVNIGAFPLRPDDDNKQLLTNFIRQLLSVPTDGESILGAVIPHKGTLLHINSTNSVAVMTLFGRHHGKKHLAWMRKYGLYNLPIDESMLDETGVNGKRWLALPPENRTGDKTTIVFRIVTLIGKVCAAELKSTYEYYKKPTHEAYWLWRIKPEH